MVMRFLALASLFFLLKSQAVSAVPDQPLLRASIIGSIDMGKSPNFFEVMNDHTIQRFLLRLSSRPIDGKEASSIIPPTRLQNLLDLGLIRSSDHLYYLNFALFTKEDDHLVRTISNRYARSLAKDFQNRRPEFDAMFLDCLAPGVHLNELAFVLIGCVCMDWGGLELTAAKTYRAPTGHRPDGNYVPHAEEVGLESVKELYWASRTIFIDNNFAFTSFGDDDAPRLTLPEDFQEPLLRIMISLRDGPKTDTKIVSETGYSIKMVDQLLHLLLGMDWIKLKHGRYLSNIPILTRKDESKLIRIKTLGFNILESWMSKNYSHIKSDFEELSFIKQGTSFQEGFSMIWHYIFGMANREMVKTGWLADPYANNRSFQGSIPFVYNFKIEK